MPKTHGETHWINGKRIASPEYNSWAMMRNRCLNPNCKDYVRYAGRGITIVPEWTRFEKFLEDMGRRPSPLHTLDRENNALGYSKVNCRWATRKEQAQNRGAYIKIGQKKADRIRSAYIPGVTRQVDVAQRFGISQCDVSQITRNVRWARETEVEDAS